MKSSMISFNSTNAEIKKQQVPVSHFIQNADWHSKSKSYCALPQHNKKQKLRMSEAHITLR